VGLYKNYLLCTSVVFLGGKIFWKKNSVKNSLFVDFSFSRKGKKYCKDFCQTSP
jgi:hypothetical protein